MDTSGPHKLLRTAMAANAVFSLATGLQLVVAPSSVGDWLGVEIDGWLRLLGVALIGHAPILAFAISRPDPRPLGKLNLAMIAPYPLMMIGLVVSGIVEPAAGQALVLADGAIVGVFGVGHALGLRRTAATETPATSTLRAEQLA